MTRYLVVFIAMASGLWVPIILYLIAAPVHYTSQMSLILPGSSLSASVNLQDIGQASSYSTSLFPANSVSPTETYKRLLYANRILRAASSSVNMTPEEFGKPTVDLVDQTTLIHVEMSGNSPVDAQVRNRALLAAFSKEVNLLRSDELAEREAGSQSAIREYQQSVLNTRYQVTKLQRESGLASPSQYYALVESTDELQNKIDEVEANLSREIGTVQGLQQQLGMTASDASKALRLSTDSAYMALMQEIASSAAALSVATARYGKMHPDTAKAKAAYDAAVKASHLRADDILGGHTEGDVRRLENMVTGGRTDLLAELVTRETIRCGLEEQLVQMQSTMKQEKKRLEELAPLATQLEDTQRDFSVAEAVFASAIARSQSGKNDIYASYPLVQVLEDPSLPTSASSPQPKLAIAAGVAATLMLAIALLLGSYRRSLVGRLLAKSAAA